MARRVLVAFALALIAAGVGSAPAAAQDDGDNCLTADPPPIDAPAKPLRFGITPRPAGTVLPTASVPDDPEASLRAVERLRPARRQVVIRLNRMFMADGGAGVRRFAAIVDRYARAGFDSELQVRYHPRAEDEGDMRAWASYVRTAARILGRRPSVKALSITNEANFTASPNTSDGSYDGARQAIVVGILAARDELDRMGRPDVELGFSFAWRWLPDSDAAFWREIGDRGTPRFRRAVDYVGLQVYPGLVWPPVPLPGRPAGEEVVEALTLLRDCYMPKGRLGRSVDLWVTENGYATNLGRTEKSQDEALASTLEWVHRYSGTLGISDYRWFNLRDNNSLGLDLFDAVGLLRDDYSPKPAFWTYRRALGRIGADQPPQRRCRKRVAIVVGTAGHDLLRGSVGPDVIVARGGADRVRGGPGDDLICAGGGKDRLRGGAGSDLLVGGKGRDRCAGGGGRDRYRGCETSR